MIEWAYLITIRHNGGQHTQRGSYDNEDDLTRAQMIDHIFYAACDDMRWPYESTSVTTLYLEPNRAGVNVGPSDAGIQDAVPEGWR